jgi:hypothetical protein
MKKISCLLFAGALFSTVISVQASEMNNIFKQAAIQDGMSAKGLWASAQIESSGNPNAVHGRYAGLINMGEDEFRKYGSPYGDRMDPLHNLLAANYYVKENAAVLREILHRQPTEAELYISLQQGRRGMIELLRNPRQLAVKVRGYDAIIGNLPSGQRKEAKRWTCEKFVGYWISRFNHVMEKVDV